MTEVDAVFASTLERARKLGRRLRIQWDPQFNKWAVVLGIPSSENDWVVDESLEEALIRVLAEERNQKGYMSKHERTVRDKALEGKVK